MKKVFKKILAVSLCATLFLNGGASAAAADETTEKEPLDFTITSPYDGVDWDNWKQYKASLHSHTDASDGAQSIAESVKRSFWLIFFQFLLDLLKVMVYNINVFCGKLPC